MIFRYYITDLFDGVVKGTNDTHQAKNFAMASGDFFVVDAQLGVLLDEEGATREILPVGDLS